MRIKKSLCLMLCLIASTIVRAEDLLQTYEIAYCNDPTLEIAKQTFMAAREELPQAGAQFLPVISANAVHQLNHTPKIAFNPIGSFTSNQYIVSLTQPIYRFEHWAKYAQASENVQAANYTYAAAEQELLLRTSERYFAVLRAIDNLRSIKAQREAFGRFLYQTNERFKVGLIAITDVEIARARHDGALAQEIAAENSLFDEKQRLREITCLNIEELCPLKNELPITSPEGEVDEWISKALAQNLELQASCYAAAAAKANIKIQRSGHLPKVDFVAQYNHTRPINIFNVDNVDTTAGIQISLPIFNGGGTSSKVRQSMHEYLKTDGQYEQLYRQVKSNTRQFYQGVITQIEQVAALKQAVVSNEAALKATNESFMVGTRTIVDVLNAQSDLIRAEIALSNAKYDYILETLRLKQAAGMLCPIDIERINTWLKKCKSGSPISCPT